MLEKLLKYEFKATGRVFLPLYAGLIAAAVIAYFALRTDIEIINILSGLLLGALYVALVIITIVLLIQRFYQSLLRDEGYLMFTLPVNPSLLIASKLISAFVWCILSMIAGAAAGLVASGSFFHISELFVLIAECMAEYPYVSVPGLLIMLTICAGLASLVCTIVQVYFSLAVGQLPVFSKHRILFAILAFLGTSAILQIVAMISGSIMMPYFSRQFNTLNIMIDMNDPSPFFESAAYTENFITELISAMNIFMLSALIFYAIFAAAMFIGTSLILKLKLNLE